MAGRYLSSSRRGGAALLGIVTAMVGLSVQGCGRFAALGDERKAPQPTDTAEKAMTTVSADPQVAENGKAVVTDCYTATFPEGYTLVGGKGCRALLNIPHMDAATTFNISPMSSQNIPEESARRTSRIIENNDGQVVSSKSVEVGGLRGFEIRYINNVGRRSRLVNVIETSPHWQTPSGNTINMFSVDGPDLPQFDTIIDTITFT